MTNNAPDKHFRKRMAVPEFFGRSPDDTSAEEWFVEMRWPDGVACPHCDCTNVQDRATHHNQRFRCRGCGRRFNPSTGIVMANSNLRFRDWLFAIYELRTSLKGVSSIRLHRDMGVTQSTAWFLMHRNRAAFTDEHRSFKPLASLGYCHAAVAHSARAYCGGEVHTNGNESLWPMFKRGYVGTYHHMSEAYTGRCVGEFVVGHNIRPLNTDKQLASVAARMVGRSLPYRRLVEA